MDMIRIWKEVDIKEIQSHLVLLDDIQGYCPSCKKTGIKYDSLKKCPSCGIEFTYAGLREKTDTRQGTQTIAKIKKNAPWLTVIDYADYTHILDRSKAQSLFKTDPQD